MKRFNFPLVAIIFVLIASLIGACAPASPQEVARAMITEQAAMTQTAVLPVGTQVAMTVSAIPQNVYDDATPTGAPALNGPTATPNSYPWECYYSGARMTDGHVPGAERIGGAGYCDVNALINSVSMQAFWEEIVNSETQLPVGLERTDVAEGTFEANNDYLRVIGIRHGNTMLYFVPDATESNSAFPFWWTSCVEYNVETGIMKFFKDDSGKPGGFDGSCTGVWKEFGGKTADKFSGEIMVYIQAIETLAAKGYKTPNQPYVLDIVWFEAWPK